MHDSRATGHSYTASHEPRLAGNHISPSYISCDYMSVRTRNRYKLQADLQKPLPFGNENRSRRQPPTFLHLQFRHRIDTVVPGVEIPNPAPPVSLVL